MTPTRLKILILGGYGTFGARLAQLLADDDRLTLIIAGRSRAKAQAFCATLPSTAVPAVFDRDANVERQLRAIAPDLVVDASGPFQGYGADPYRVVKASLVLGIHYLDLADGAEFVQGITQFDALARARRFRACRSEQLSGPHRGSGQDARARHGAHRAGDRRDCAFALRQGRHERDPRDRELWRQTDHHDRRWLHHNRLRAHRLPALHHRAAGPDAA